MTTANNLENERNIQMEHVYILKAEALNAYRVIGKESKDALSHPSDFKTTLKEAERLNAEITLQKLSIKNQPKPQINPHSYDFYFSLLFKFHFKHFPETKHDYIGAFKFIDEKVRQILTLKDQ